jgi:hypothetical protein
VNKLLSVAVAAIVSSAREPSGFRRIGAGAIAPAVLALWCVASWSPGATALTSVCEGATGTSTVTNIPQLFNLQCVEAIQIPGKPLQTFGSSAFVRKNGTTASYFLADRSNLGIDLINGTTLKFTKLLKPTAKDPAKGFLGQLIYRVA